MGLREFKYSTNVNTNKVTKTSCKLHKTSVYVFAWSSRGQIWSCSIIVSNRRKCPKSEFCGYFYWKCGLHPHILSANTFPWLNSIKKMNFKKEASLPFATLLVYSCLICFFRTHNTKISFADAEKWPRGKHYFKLQNFTISKYIWIRCLVLRNMILLIEYSP